MWQIEGSLARWRTPELAATLAPSTPQDGLTLALPGETALENARFLQIRISRRSDSETLRECYVRGRDLIAHYGETNDQSYCPEVYWRFIDPQDAGGLGIELIVSVHTDLLDVDASLVIGSVIPCVEWLRMVDVRSGRLEAVSAAANQADASGVCGPVLYRLPGRTTSYAEMVHPSDLLTADSLVEQVSLGWVRSSSRLFHEHLEKGVIRRARVRGIFLPADGDETAAAHCYRRFIESAAPLSV